jgi:predicted nucleic acid-binding protein
MIDHSIRGIITQDFFKFVEEKNHEIVISTIVNEEIYKALPEKKEEILNFLKQLNNVTILSADNDSYNLALKYIKEGILTESHLNDLLHVAYATVSACDVIVSWNRKHLAKESKIQKINFCNIRNNYQSIIICTPQDFLNNSN